MTETAPHSGGHEGNEPSYRHRILSFYREGGLFYYKQKREWGVVSGGNREDAAAL